jgi:hypothetical protein
MDKLVIQAIFVAIAEVAFIVFMIYMIIEKSKER